MQLRKLAKPMQTDNRYFTACRLVCPLTAAFRGGSRTRAIAAAPLFLPVPPRPPPPFTSKSHSRGCPSLAPMRADRICRRHPAGRPVEPPIRICTKLIADRQGIRAHVCIPVHFRVFRRSETQTQRFHYLMRSCLPLTTCTPGPVCVPQEAQQSSCKELTFPDAIM